MSTVATVHRLHEISPGMVDIVDHLTLNHAELVERHGPLLGFAAPPPTEAVQYAAEAARKAVLIDTASDPKEKAIALLDKEAHRHQQIGRLSYWIAGYELAHGDVNNAAPMQRLGNDHFELAERLQKEMKVERGEGPATPAVEIDRNAALFPPDICAEIAATNQNERGPGRRR